MTTFEPFPKIPRLSRECVVTEKIDGTNASIWILDAPGTIEDDVIAAAKLVEVNGHAAAVVAGSRKRFITPGDDNFGFARWVHENAEELAVELGYGTHFGEWWGLGIQRKYDQEEKRFSLFNTGVWKPEALRLCDVVPVLYEGLFDTGVISMVLEELRHSGSNVAPGFMNAEGIMIFHTASRGYFKKTLKDDAKGKGS